MKPSNMFGTIGIIWYAIYVTVVMLVVSDFPMQCFCIYSGTIVPLAFFLIASWIRYNHLDDYIRNRVKEQRRAIAQRKKAKNKK